VRGLIRFGRAANLFDKRYATGGALAENPFVGAGNAFESDPDEWRHEQFIAPGAPRAGGLVGRALSLGCAITDQSQRHRACLAFALGMFASGLAALFGLFQVLGM